MRHGTLVLKVVWVGAILLAGCTASPPPVPTPPETHFVDCTVETVTTQLAYHNWTLTTNSENDYRFEFENLTKILFTIEIASPAAVFWMGNDGGLTNWSLKDPGGYEAWAHRGTGGGPGDPRKGTTAVFTEEWGENDLGRLTGTWILHLDGRMNAKATIRLEGTSTPCAITEKVV